MNPLRTNSSSRPTAKRGFTLIEMLVVIAIISVLTALLIPALTKAKRNARNVACLSNLRQLGVATRMYADENEQRMPSAELLPSQPVEPGSPKPRISSVLAPLLGRTIGNTNSVGVFKCPADSSTRFQTEGSSYEWNVELNARRIDETRSAALRIVRVEVINGEEVVKEDGEKTLQFPPETTPLLLDYEENHPRPPKPGKNVVFMDGHTDGLELPAIDEP